MSKKGAAILFFISLILFLSFMIRFRDGIPQSSAIFWLLLLVLFSSPLYQILRFGNDKGWANFILVQIIFAAFAFNIIYPMLLVDRTAFPVDDSYVFLDSAGYLASYSDYWTSGPLYNRWPILQYLLLMSSDVSGVDLLDIGLILPTFYIVLWVVFVYLIARELYSDNNKVALLAALACTPFLIRWLLAASPTASSLAKVFLMACIFAYIRRLRHTRTSTIYSLLALLFMLSVILTHHGTSMYLTVFFAAMFLHAWLGKFFRPSEHVGRSYESPILTFLTLSTVAWLSYWMQVGEPILATAAHAVVGATAPSPVFEAKAYTSTLPTDPRDLIVYWEGNFYVILFALMLVYEVFRRRRCPDWESDSLIFVWAGFSLIMWMVVNGIGSQMYTSERVVRIAYPFILMAVAHIMLTFGSRWRTFLFAFLLLTFMLFTVYANPRITAANPLAQYALPEPEPGGGMQQVQAASFYPGEGGAVVVVNMGLMFNYINDIEPGISMSIFEDDLSGLKDYSFLYLDQGAWFTVSGKMYTDDVMPLDEETRAKISTSSWLSMVYDNGGWQVYAISS